MPTPMVRLDVDDKLWERVFTPAPLVVVGSKEPDGSYNLAPKHMVAPVGFDGWFAFVCTPRHGTWQNVLREGVFTVSWPRPDSVVVTALSATPRWHDGSKPSTLSLPTIPAQVVDGRLIEDGRFHLECRLARVIDGFGSHGLIVGRIVAAHAAADALRGEDRDDADLMVDDPPMVYLHPTRFAPVGASFSFPFPAGFER